MEWTSVAICESPGSLLCLSVHGHRNFRKSEGVISESRTNTRLGWHGLSPRACSRIVPDSQSSNMASALGVTPAGNSLPRIFRGRLFSENRGFFLETVRVRNWSRQLLAPLARSSPISVHPPLQLVGGLNKRRRTSWSQPYLERADWGRDDAGVARERAAESRVPEGPTAADATSDEWRLAANRHRRVRYSIQSAAHRSSR